MIQFNVKADVTKALAKLDLARKQVPFATALALTRTAQFAKGELTKQMSVVFDRPTAYTLNSLYVRTARKTDLNASVEVKDENFKGAAPSRWLRPEIYGGNRDLKRSEQLLQAKRLMPVGSYMVPGAGAKMDSHGNMSRAQIQQILSGVGAQFDTLQNRTARSTLRHKAKRMATYFAVPVRTGNLAPGIYARTGKRIKPVMLFVRQPRYQKRFDFYTLGQRVMQERFPTEFESAARYAMDTAR